jgi:hypothetical protein
MTTPIALHAATVIEALDRADLRHFTRRPPRSEHARLRYLMGRLGGSVSALAGDLGADPEELAGIAAGRHVASAPVSAALEREVLHAWQPRIRRAAHEAVIGNHGVMMLSFRARFGFTAANGTTDDPRMRALSLALHAPYPGKLLRACHRNAPETELRQILSQALAASYFHHHNTAAPGVTLTDIAFLEFYY